jgi:hypothetical protein
MRKLAFLLLVAVALPSFAATYGTVVIRDGDHQYSQGDSREIGRTANLGQRYAFFERDGVAYVIRDADTLVRIRAVIKPQEDLGERQAKLGAEQAALGAQQAALGAKQAALGLQEAASASSARSKELGARQRELARQQEKLAAQQEPLAEQQRVLGEKQHEASKVARRQLEKLFEDAIRSGIAKRI